MATTTAAYPAAPQVGFDRGTFGVKANIRIDEGSLVMIDTTAGTAEGAEPMASQRCIGWAAELADNTGGVASAVRVTVTTETASFENSTVTPVTAAMVGSSVWAESPTTVKGSAGTNPVVVGTLFGFAADGRPIIRFV
ncbi:MAG: hypothetical protein DVB22_002584 [Verrucomicrobia bacterium]|nr:MAG: hypothetical protein DVB22_002584 [Verrucomicrobiota bacterium]